MYPNHAPGCHVQPGCPSGLGKKPNNIAIIPNASWAETNIISKIITAKISKSTHIFSALLKLHIHYSTVP